MGEITYNEPPPGEIRAKLAHSLPAQGAWYQPGSTVVLEAAALNAMSAPVGLPAAVFRVRLPDGKTISVAAAQAPDGMYRAKFLPFRPGTYWWRLHAEDAEVELAPEAFFRVRQPRV